MIPGRFLEALVVALVATLFVPDALGRFSKGQGSFTDGDDDLELSTTPTPPQPPHRRQVVVVAAVADLDVRFGDQAAVGRVKPDPAVPRQKRLDPGVRRFCADQGFVPARARVDIARHVTGRDTRSAAQRQHRVREVLTHP